MSGIPESIEISMEPIMSISGMGSTQPIWLPGKPRDVTAGLEDVGIVDI
jgi:hypothetical protein